MIGVVLACHDPDPPASTGDSAVPPRVFDDAHVLVVPDGDGLKLLNPDGSRAYDHRWSDLVPGCDVCGGEGSSADGDGLLVAFTTNGPVSGGAIARLDHTGGLDFEVDALAFPHGAVRDSDGAIAIPEANANRMRWIAGDGSSSAAVRSLDDSDPDWPGDTPNGLHRVDHDGRTGLVVSHRGGGGGGVLGSGEITMWDLTDPAAPTLRWTFPATGQLATPHGARMFERDGRWWLIYAHTLGSDHGSTVGLAVTDDPDTAPAYVADLVAPGPVGPLVFLRGVELTDDGQLLLTDSGGPGRVLSAAMPELEPTGASGSTGGGQVFVDLDRVALVADGLSDPFEGWLWVPTFPGVR